MAQIVSVLNYVIPAQAGIQSVRFTHSLALDTGSALGYASLVRYDGVRK